MPAPARLRIVNSSVHNNPGCGSHIQTYAADDATPPKTADSNSTIVGGKGETGSKISGGFVTYNEGVMLAYRTVTSTGTYSDTATNNACKNGPDK